jgi:ATP-dependent Clp protease protease subunit
MATIELPYNNEPNAKFGDQAPPKEFRIYLTDEIRSENATKIVEQMFEINEINEQFEYKIPIRLIINTPGGELHASQMICDVMDEIKTAVHTSAYGKACSGGFMIMMNGEPGFRTCTESTQFMSHRFITAMEGSHTDFIYHQEEMNRMHERLVSHYAKCTGLSAKKIEKELLSSHDVWLDAARCKSFNVIDRIIPTKKRYAQRNKPD